MSAMSERAAVIDQLITDLPAEDLKALAERLASEVGYVLEAEPEHPDGPSEDTNVDPVGPHDAPSRADIEQVIAEADRRLAYNMNLIRLVDGDHTYRLSIDGQTLLFTDSETPDWNAYDRLMAHIADCKGRVRADAILSLFSKALTSQASSAAEAMAWLAARPNYELSHGYDDPEDEGSWRVHRVNGGVNDREWTLVATGSTPLYAVRAAMEVGGS